MNIVEHGVEISEGFLSNSIVFSIIEEMKDSSEGKLGYGIRNAEKKFESIRDLVTSDLLISRAKKILGTTPEVVRVIFFNKTADQNWLVTWHQDKTIAVSHRAVVPGWDKWTLKDGINHVQPSLDVLESMITFRLHLDDANVNNGCLKVIPKSHRHGILSQAEINEMDKEQECYTCTVKAGGLLIMRPHLLHSSSKALSPINRRIVHVEYSDYSLPGGLKWA